MQISRTMPGVQPLIPHRAAENKQPTGAYAMKSPASGPLAPDAPALLAATDAVKPSVAPPAVEAAECNGPRQYTEKDLHALIDDWGSCNSEYDLNGDGTVNVNDLLAMVANWQHTLAGETGGTCGVGEPALPPDDTDQDNPPGGGPVVTGATGPVRGEGARRPHKQDSLGGGSATALAPTADAPKQDRATTLLHDGRLRPALHAYAQNASAIALGGARANAAVSGLGDSLVDRLMGAGFANQPPTNLHELVQGLNLSEKDADGVLSRVKERYGERMSINTVA